MTFASRGIRGLVLLVATLGTGTGCRSAAPPPAGVVLAPGAGVVGPGSATAIAAAERAERAFTQADGDFMAGLIPHHAQAVTMASWAVSHGARADVRLFSEKVSSPNGTRSASSRDGSGSAGCRCPTRWPRATS